MDENERIEFLLRLMNLPPANELANPKALILANLQHNEEILDDLGEQALRCVEMLYLSSEDRKS